MEKKKKRREKKSLDLQYLQDGMQIVVLYCISGKWNFKNFLAKLSFGNDLITAQKYY